MGPVTIASGTRVYLDANVMIYASELPDAYPLLTAMLDRAERGEVATVTSALTLAEVLVLPIRTGNALVEDAYRTRLAGGSTLAVHDVTRDVLARAAALRASTASLRPPDAIHLATAIVTGCDVFLSNDGRLRSTSQSAMLQLPDLG